MSLRSVVLVGNGFDISIGMETSASAFLESFVQESVDSNIQFARDLANRISVDGVDTWADFERMIGRYSENFNLSSVESYLGQKEALDDYLGEWLEKKNESVTESFVKANAMKCLSSLTRFRHGLPDRQRGLIERIMKSHSAEDWVLDIICFNYTDTLMKMHKLLGGEGTKLGSFIQNRYSVLGKFVFAHGSLEQREIISGVDNPSQIASSELAKLDEVKRALVKEEIEASVYQRTRDADALSLIRKANIIYVFGMSYGITDERWWKAIDGRMSSDGNCLLILFSLDYSRSLSGSYSPVSRARITNQVVESFLASRGNVDSDKEYRDRIIVADSGLLLPITSSLTR